MKHNKFSLLFPFLLAAAFLLSSCAEDAEDGESSAAPSAEISNRINLPSEIIANLGVTFEKVKRGKVGVWLNVPGVLRTPEERSFTLNAPAQGRLRLIKSLWDEVEKGEAIAEIISPELVAIQEELVAASNLQQHAQAEASSASIPGAKNRAAQATRTFRQRLKSLSVLTGQSEESLTERDAKGEPKWMSLSSLTIAAPSAGSIIELKVATGDFVQTASPIARLIDRSTLIFQGRVAESELNRLRREMPATIVLEGFSEAISTTARLLPVTDSGARLLLVEAEFPNIEGKVPDGLSATARVLVKEGVNEEATVHPDCVVLDGLEHLVFKRDPEKPDFVVRTPVELGTVSDEAVEILFGVMEGDEVVRNGVQQLKQTGLGKAPAGGHFHADGTWHEGDK